MQTYTEGQSRRVNSLQRSREHSKFQLCSSSERLAHDKHVFYT